MFANVRSGSSDDDYLATAARMEELARSMDGFLGVDSVRSPDGTGITVSYWRDPEAAAAWRAHGEHADARRRGMAEWYATYTLDVGWTVRTSTHPDD